VSRDKELEAVEAQLQEARGSREQLARESEAEIGQREDRILILKKEVSGLGGEVERAQESAREMKEALKCAKDEAWSARAEHEDSIRDLELTLASSRRREEELEHEWRRSESIIAKSNVAIEKIEKENDDYRARSEAHAEDSRSQLFLLEAEKEASIIETRSKLESSDREIKSLEDVLAMEKKSSKDELKVLNETIYRLNKSIEEQKVISERLLAEQEAFATQNMENLSVSREECQALAIDTKNLKERLKRAEDSKREIERSEAGKQRQIQDLELKCTKLLQSGGVLEEDLVREKAKCVELEDTISKALREMGESEERAVRSSKALQGQTEELYRVKGELVEMTVERDATLKED